MESSASVPHPPSLISHFSPSPSPAIQLRLRVFCGAEAALGPGRADLLARVAGTESIAQAARDMGMSYMKAWKLIQSMNRCFTGPLLEVRRGGRAGGQARLTALGATILEMYQEMERASLAATRPFEARLREVLRTPEAVAASEAEPEVSAASQPFLP